MSIQETERQIRRKQEFEDKKQEQQETSVSIEEMRKPGTMTPAWISQTSDKTNLAQIAIHHTQTQIQISAMFPFKMATQANTSEHPSLSA